MVAVEALVEAELAEADASLALVVAVEALFPAEVAEADASLALVVAVEALVEAELAEADASLALVVAVEAEVPASVAYFLALKPCPVTTSPADLVAQSLALPAATVPDACRFADSIVAPTAYSLAEYSDEATVLPVLVAH